MLHCNMTVDDLKDHLAKLKTWKGTIYLDCTTERSKLLLAKLEEDISLSELVILKLEQYTKKGNIS